MRKKLIIILLSLNAFLVGGIFLLSLLVNKETVKHAIVNAFGTATGFMLEIQGDAEVKAFPLPHVIIHSVYVSNAQGAAMPFLLSMESLDVRPSLASLLGSKEILASLEVKDLKIEIERLKNGEMNWEAMRKEHSYKAENTPAAGVSGRFGVHVESGELHYADAASGETSEFRDISLLLEDKNGTNAVNGSFKAAGKTFTVTGSMGNPLQIVSGMAPVNLRLATGETSVTYDGQAGYKDSNYLSDGSVAVKTDDLTPWLALLLGDSPEPLDNAAYLPLPLGITAKITGDGSKTHITGISLEGPFIKGSGEATLAGVQHADVKATIDTLDGEAIAGSRITHLKIPGLEIKRDEFGAEIAPASTFSLGTSIKVADTVYNGQHIKDMQLAFDWSGSGMVITQAQAMLPGESLVMLSGGIGRENDEGFSIDGRIDARGDNLTQAMTVFKPSGFAIPPEDFKRFALRANAAFSAKAMQLSEFAGRIENMGLRGGIVVLFDHRPRLLATLRIGGINLDHMLVLWGLSEWENSFKNETTETRNDALLSQWLKKLGYDISLSASLEQYTLGGKERDRGDFKLNATQGKIELNDLLTTYNGTMLGGNASLNVMETPPRVNIDMSADTLDTDAFFNVTPITAVTPSPTAERWSHEGFDFHWFELLNGTFHLKLGHLKYRKFQAEATDIQGSLDTRKLTVDSLHSVILGAQVVGKAVLVGGKIPTLSAAGNVADLESSALAPYIPSLASISGSYNLKLTLNTSGIDMYSWVSNMGGTLGIAGRNLVIHGFNLPGIMQAVGYVRTVADILGVVQRAFPGGDTAFTTAEGQWTANNGALRTGDMEFSNEQSRGQAATEINFVDWKIRSHVLFTLKSLDPLHPPTMAINISGDLDAPEKTLDTRALEQYVTERTSEKILDKK